MKETTSLIDSVNWIHWIKRAVSSLEKQLYRHALANKSISSNIPSPQFYLISSHTWVVSFEPLCQTPGQPGSVARPPTKIQHNDYQFSLVPSFKSVNQRRRYGGSCQLWRRGCMTQLRGQPSYVRSSVHKVIIFSRTMVALVHVTAVTRESGGHLSEDRALRRGKDLRQERERERERETRRRRWPNGKQRERPEVLDNVSRW